MENEFKPPVTFTEATKMIAPLNPSARSTIYTDDQKELAFDRLVELLSLLLAD